MHSLEVLCVIIIIPLMLDLILHYAYIWLGHDHHKRASLCRCWALLLSIKHKYHKLTILKLSILTIIFFILIFAHYWLLYNYNNINILSLLIIGLLPIFIMPLLHLIADIIDINALSSNIIIDNFRLRSIIAFILCSSIVWAYFSTQQLLAVFYMLCFYLSIFILFYFIIRGENTAYNITIRWHHHNLWLHVKILNHMIAIMEFSYGCLFSVIFFMHLTHLSLDFYFIIISFIVMLTLLTIIIKFIYIYIEDKLYLYETILLPVSLLVFALNKIMA